MRISDWSSDVCSSDLALGREAHHAHENHHRKWGRNIADEIAAALAGDVRNDLAGKITQLRLARRNRARTEERRDRLPVPGVLRRIEVQRDQQRRGFDPRALCITGGQRLEGATHFRTPTMARELP